MESRFAKIPQKTKNLLRKIFKEHAPADRYYEATEQLGRRPTTDEWIWALHCDWDLVFDDNEGSVR